MKNNVFHQNDKSATFCHVNEPHDKGNKKMRITSYFENGRSIIFSKLFHNLRNNVFC